MHPPVWTLSARHTFHSIPDPDLPFSCCIYITGYNNFLWLDHFVTDGSPVVSFKKEEEDHYITLHYFKMFSNPFFIPEFLQPELGPLDFFDGAPIYSSQYYVIVVVTAKKVFIITQRTSSFLSRWSTFLLLDLSLRFGSLR